MTSAWPWLGGADEGGVAVVVVVVGVDPAHGQQGVDDLRVAVVGRQHEGSPAPGVSVVGVDPAHGQQGVDDLGVAALGHEDEGGSAPGVGVGWRRSRPRPAGKRTNAASSVLRSCRHA